MKFFQPSQFHHIRNEFYTCKQKELETRPEACERFKNSFRKCPKLDIPKQAQVYLFYYRLRPEFNKTTNALAGDLVIKMKIDDPCEIYKKIIENQVSWPTREISQRKKRVCIT